MFWFDKLRFGAKAFGLTASFLLIVSCAHPKLAASSENCSLTKRDLLENARLSFGEFDQPPGTPTSSRGLAKKGCYAEAARAGQDYLARTHIDSERYHSAAIFHVGQYLAMSGDHERAALVIAAAKRPGQPADAALDWNTYVTGTWAFLTNDRELLDSSYNILSSQPGESNQINARVLSCLRKHFGEMYSAGYSNKCTDEEKNNNPARR